MNEQLYRDFITVCEAQIKHIAMHHAENVEIHGDHEALERFQKGIDQTQALLDLAEAVGGTISIEDMIVKSCWGLAGLWIDMQDDADFADFIHTRAIMSARERNP
jgi:hypothetical protein